MALVKLICKQCGGQMDIDDSKEIGTCMFCGTKHIIFRESDTTQYKNAGELVRDGRSFLGLGHADKAHDAFKRAIRMDPENADAWRGYAAALSASRSSFMRAEAPAAFATAYKLTVCGTERDRLVELWLRSSTTTPECAAVYKTVDDAHRSAVIERWMSVTKDPGEVYDLVDGIYKEAVLTKWIENVENYAGGYYRLYTILCRVRGKAYADRNIVPGWVDRIKARLADGGRPPEPSLIPITFKYLDGKEKEKAINILIDDVRRSVGSADHQRKRTELTALAVEDRIAMDAVSKMERSFFNADEGARIVAAFKANNKDKIRRNWIITAVVFMVAALIGAAIAFMLIDSDKDGEFNNTAGALYSFSNGGTTYNADPGKMFIVAAVTLKNTNCQEGIFTDPLYFEFRVGGVSYAPDPVTHNYPGNSPPVKLNKGEKHTFVVVFHVPDGIMQGDFTWIGPHKVYYNGAL